MPPIFGKAGDGDSRKGVGDRGAGHRFLYRISAGRVFQPGPSFMKCLQTRAYKCAVRVVHIQWKQAAAPLQVPETRFVPIVS